MKQVATMFQRHQVKLWGFTVVVLGLIALNVAAQKDEPPAQWEYKTVGLKVDSGDNMARLQNDFAGTLNREAADGWEFVGRCAHVDGQEFWIDYVVFKRPRR